MQTFAFKVKPWHIWAELHCLISEIPANECLQSEKKGSYSPFTSISVYWHHDGSSVAILSHNRNLVGGVIPGRISTTCKELDCGLPTLFYMNSVVSKQRCGVDVIKRNTVHPVIIFVIILYNMFHLQTRQSFSLNKYRWKGTYFTNFVWWSLYWDTDKRELCSCYLNGLSSLYNTERQLC
jgi:hypothetical protein